MDLGRVLPNPPLSPRNSHALSYIEGMSDAGQNHHAI